MDNTEDKFLKSADNLSKPELFHKAALSHFEKFKSVQIMMEYLWSFDFETQCVPLFYGFFVMFSIKGEKLIGKDVI